KNKHWTQQELADKLGITRSNLIAIENGRSDFRVSLIPKLIILFDVKVESIFSKKVIANKTNSELQELKKRIEKLEQHYFTLTKNG
ncbi:MAG: helix-turn-helix transcriptional regulator, partial [Flavobacteriales bacterium]